MNNQPEAREDIEAILYALYQSGLRQGKWLVQNTGPNSPVPMQPSMDIPIYEAMDALARLAAPKPEGQVEYYLNVLKRVKYYAENKHERSAIIRTCNEALAKYKAKPEPKSCTRCSWNACREDHAAQGRDIAEKCLAEVGARRPRHVREAGGDALSYG